MSREGILHKLPFPIGRWKYGLFLLFLLVAILLVEGGRWIQHHMSKPVLPGNLIVNMEKTEEYVLNLRIEQFELHGADFTSQNYAPTRLNIPLGKINHLKDYDFQSTTDIRKTLEGVSRKVALQHIFSKVTEGQHSNTDKHIAMLKFLHKSSFHNASLQPIEQTGSSVEDPLILLHLGEMHCSHVSRVAVDLFESAGFRARVVQLGDHQIAEIYYDGGWHYFDGDLFGNGETIVDKNGNIPSVVELSKDPFAIDALGHSLELRFDGEIRIKSTLYPSYPYFGRAAYGSSGGNGLYYEKTATERDEQNYRFGWDSYKTSTDDSRVLHEMSPLYQPGAVMVTRIAVDRNNVKGTVILNWEKVKDRDDDVLGYKVFVSHQSRGWEYGNDLGIPTKGREFVFRTGGWRPSMYEKIFEVPPHDVALVSTKNLFVEIPLPLGEEYFITVMPFDAHGEEVGKQLYLLSHEFYIDLRKTVT